MAYGRIYSYSSTISFLQCLENHFSVHDPHAIGHQRAPMTIPTNVIAYLRRQTPHAYCDECIAQKLGARTQQVQPITATLGLTPGFSRKSGFCQECSVGRRS